MTTREFLRGLPVFAGDLPSFDPDAAAERPDRQFLAWLRTAVEAGIREPHAMTLSTVDEAGMPAARTLILKDVDDDGWQFAGQKGDIAAAALTFYWREQGRQIRVRGPVTVESAERSAADFLARSPSARAEALAGSAKVLGTIEVAPGWRLYTLRAREVEFFQGDPGRRHTRLRYTRDGDGWRRQLLWP